MAEDKLNNMRNKLKINDLDESSRRKMFQDFVNAGGQVVDLNKKEKQEKQSAKRSAPVTREATKFSRDGDAKSRASDKSAKDSRHAQSRNPDDNPVNKWAERFSAKLGCCLSGIFNMRANKFKNKFAELVLAKYQNSLLEARMVLASALQQNQMVAEEIRKNLDMDTSHPYLYELMYRFFSIYDENLFNNINILRNDPKRVDELKPYFLELFKPLYLLRSFLEVMKSAVEKALLFEKEIRRLDANITFSNYRKICISADFIFYKVYPKLFSLVDFYYKSDTRHRNIGFREYLRISEEDGIGHLTEKWKEEREHEARKERVREDLKGQGGVSEDTESEKIFSDDSALNAGLAIIRNNLNFKQVLQDYRTQKDLRALFTLNDKVFLTYALVDFFDKEYSFIFTATKVKFNVHFAGGTRMDIKKDLSDAYYKINSIFERVNEYLKVMRKIRKIDNDSFASMEERSARLNQNSVQRSHISRNIRKDARILFENFSKNLLFVITDYDGARNVLQNPDEILEFNKKIDGDRIVNGKKVIDAIKDAYYTAYLIHLLLVEGELGGFSVVLEKPVYLPVNL